MNPSSQTDSYAQAGNWLMGTVRRNPEGLLLLAAGCALLLRSGRNGGRSAMSRGNFGDPARHFGNPANAASGIRKELSNTADSAADYAAELKERASGVVSAYADSVSGFADDARRAVSESSERFARQAQSTMQSTMNRVLRDQPLAVAMAGLAAGAAVAAAFPTTEVENRVLGGTHDALSNAVDQAGKSVMGAATKAGERLKTAAEERGLTPDGLKELASEVAGSFTDAVAGKTDQQSSKRGSAGQESGGFKGNGESGRPTGNSWPNAGGTR